MGMTARKGEAHNHRSEEQEAQLSTWLPGEGPESLRDREDSGNTGNSACACAGSFVGRSYRAL